MIITLTDGETIFNLTTGVGRDERVLSSLDFDLSQTTQEVVYTRAAWPTAFPSRASRSLTLTLPVTHPPCASLEAALKELADWPLTCPRGGVLTLQKGAMERSYAQAWLVSCRPVNRGVSNEFTWTFRVKQPTEITRSTLAQMDSRYIANLHAITGLTGGGATNLNGLTTTDVGAGFTAVIMPDVGGIIVARTFRLDAGTTAQNLDPAAGALVVRPLDYNASTNAKVWVQISAE